MEIESKADTLPVKIPCNRYAMPCLIALAGLLAYSNTFHVPFQFDDDAYIVNNPAIRSFHYVFTPGDVGTLPGQSPTSVPDALRYAFKTRIVGYATFAANYALHGLDVAGYHVFNLLVHVLNGLLVYLLVGATLKTGRFSSLAGTGRDRMREAMPAVSALLFVCHPIQTQAVTYISQRFASLASFFFLLALLLHVQARFDKPGYKRVAL